MSEVSTAIMLFTRTAQEEAVAKSWSGRARNRQIAKLLIRNSRKILQASGIPFIIHQNQQGDTFGEKLQHAFVQAFAKGFDQVICIGNDTPSLNEATLQKASKELSHGKEWILGPSQDGGVYLIGMKKSCFEQLDFQSIPWHSDQVFHALQTAFIQQSHTGSTLSIQQDIDNAQDIAEILSRVFRQLACSQALVRIFQEKPFFPLYIPHFSLQKEIPLLAGVFRGPPERVEV